jgi:hypothetical protein
MKRLNWLLLIIHFLFLGQLLCQTTPFSFRSSIGLANYYGDLTEKLKFFNQSSANISLGLDYDITEQLVGRFNFSLMKLKADDRFNKRQDLIDRNLNFTTSLWEISLGAEYDFLNMASEEYILTPYLGFGIGIFHFNPWTYDRTGVKRYLREYGTEGQGLPSYPERKVYSNYALSFPLNFGFKYALNENIKLIFDISLRKTTTDYIDDVGNYYPDKDVILREAKDPITTIGLTYRGDEINPGSSYPSTSLVRGGYTKDFFYTTNIGLIIRLNNIVIGGGGRSGGSSLRTGKIGSRSSRLKSPGRVF